MRKLLHLLLLSTGAILASTHVEAGLVNDVPSCYSANHFRFASPPPTRLAYILIDQTVQLDPALQKEAIDNAVRLLGPSTKFVIAEFSAFSQGHYLNVLNTGVVESPMTTDQRNNVPVSSLGRFDACMQGQASYSITMIKKDVGTALTTASSSLDKSDIMYALKTISTAVANDSAKQKVVFVITDALENSSVTSFYSHNTVRIIDPPEEVRKAATNKMFGNFGGASIYLLGAGTMPPPEVGSRAVRNGYRDPRILQSLKDFWQQYFERSNAHLTEFGTPALVRAVEY